MHCYEVIMQAHPLERAVLLDAIRDASDVTATHEFVGRLSDRLRGAPSAVSRACSQCRGRLNRLCVICGGSGSIRVVVEPDPILDRDARALCSAVKGGSR